MAGFRKFVGTRMLKSQKNEVRRKRDFRLFSLIMVVVSTWGNRRPNREKIPMSPYARALLTKPCLKYKIYFFFKTKIQRNFLK